MICREYVWNNEKFEVVEATADIIDELFGDGDRFTVEVAQAIDDELVKLAAQDEEPEVRLVVLRTGLYVHAKFGVGLMTADLTWLSSQIQPEPDSCDYVMYIAHAGDQWRKFQSSRTNVLVGAA